MSVRVRLTLVIGMLVAALAAGAAVIAPSLVEDALIDDILDADAEFQSLILDDAGAAFSFPLADEVLVEAFPPNVVIDQLGAAELQALIDASDGDDLVVAVGGDAFVRVSGDGQQRFALADPITIDQPILSVFELFERPSGSAVSIDGFPEGVIEDRIFSDLLITELGAAERVATGVRAVDGVSFFVSGDVSSVDRTVGRVRTVLWTAAPLIVLTAVLITWVLAGRALRPVRAITEQAGMISGGTLGERVPVPTSNDEIATLATTVNGMLDRLEHDDVRRRRFVSDASHELRTPVAVITSEAEVALRAPEGTDVESLASGVLEESTRLASIIDDLLALARHDEGIAAPTTEIDLDDIVLAEAGRLRRVPIDVSGVSAGRVLGRHDEFARVVAHLLDNAARHSAGVVAVSLTTTASTDPESASVVLTVDDDGPGVAPADRDAIFERFTRLDAARARDAGGAGLGLAVTAGVVQRSGGLIRVDDAPQGGARFVVTLPAR